MATFAQIKSVRLTVKDPVGYIDLQEVDAYPYPSASQTAYTMIGTGVYQYYNGSKWVTLKLNISDEQIGLLIDLYGVDKACIRVVQSIINALGQELRFASQNDGVESIQYTSLQTIYDYYKGIKDSLKEDIAIDAGTNTGCSFHTCSRPVGGVWEW